MKHIGYILRFLWNATRGHRLAPWRSAYLRWRIETYTGLKMQSIGFLEFWGFSWRERPDSQAQTCARCSTGPLWFDDRCGTRFEAQ